MNPDELEQKIRDAAQEAGGRVVDPEIALRFLPRAGDDNEVALHAMSFAGLVCDKLPHSRERSIALTLIEEAVLWTQAAIRRQTGWRCDTCHRRLQTNSEAAVLRCYKCRGKGPGQPG